MERTQKSRFLGFYSVYTVLSHGKLLIYTLSFKIYINVAVRMYTLLNGAVKQAQPWRHRTRETVQKHQSKIFKETFGTEEK